MSKTVKRTKDIEVTWGDAWNTFERVLGVSINDEFVADRSWELTKDAIDSINSDRSRPLTTLQEEKVRSLVESAVLDDVWNRQKWHIEDIVEKAAETINQFARMRAEIAHYTDRKFGSGQAVEVGQSNKKGILLTVRDSFLAADILASAGLYGLGDEGRTLQEVSFETVLIVYKGLVELTGSRIPEFEMDVDPNIDTPSIERSVSPQRKRKSR